MTRKVAEWIGKTPDTPAPQLVKAKIKRRISPLSMDHIEAWSTYDQATGCWNWQRAISPNGYGVLRDGGKTKRAHRVAYEIHNGISLPPNVDVCHMCDNRACVNPAHLFEGSRKDNMRDCANKGRIKTPGLRGESLTQSKLTESEVLKIRESGESQRALAKKFKVSRRTIVFIQQRKTWKHI